MTRHRFNRMCRMIGVVAIVTLFCSCKTATLRQAQNEYNQGVILENAAAGKFTYAEAHYKSALALLDEVQATGNDKLDISKEVLTALCLWRTQGYGKADNLLQTLKTKASKAAPRDRVLIYLLPALIRIDEAKKDIPLKYNKNMQLEKEVVQKIDKALDEIDSALTHAKSPMITRYVRESGLEAYRVRQWAHNALGDRSKMAFNETMTKKIIDVYINPLPSTFGEQWRKTLGI